MKKLTLLFVLSILALGSSKAEDLSHRLYIGGDVGVIWRDLDGPLVEHPIYQGGFHPSRTSFRRRSDDAEGYIHGRLGVKITDFFSIEAGYQDFGYTYVDIEPPTNVIFLVPPPTNYRFRDYSFTFDPVFHWAINERVKVYAFWGLALNRTRVDVDYRGSIYSGVYQDARPTNSSSNLSRLGAGADVHLVQRLDLHAGVDYQRFASFSKEGWLAHAGVNYTF